MLCTAIEVPKRNKKRKLKTQRKQDTYPKFNMSRARVQSQMPVTGTETGGKGAGHKLYKRDIARGHNMNRLEPNRPKMVGKSTSTRP